MISNITLFNNTGLVPGECMESYDKLISAGFVTITVEDIALKQNKGITGIQVGANWNKINHVDYATVDKFCYWVTNITMLNDNVAFLSLVPDYMTTVGVKNINVISGWCTRRTVGYGEDELFYNTIDEPFTPTEDFKLDVGGILYHKSNMSTDDFSSLGVVVTTADLSVAAGYTGAKPWSDGETVGLYTPSITPIEPNKQTEYFMNVWERKLNGETADTPLIESAVVPFTAAFNYSNETVGRNVATLLSIGLDSTIRETYSLPLEWVDSYEFDDGSVENNGVWINNLACEDLVVNSDLYPTVIITGDDGNTYNPQNNKVFSGQFQRICIASLTSGELKQFRADEIYDKGETELPFQYRSVADLRYVGKPMIYPKIYMNSENKIYNGVVSGTVWQGLSILSIGVSGYALKNQEDLFNTSIDSASSILGSVGNIKNNVDFLNSPFVSTQSDNNAYGNIQSGVGGLKNVLTGTTTNVGKKLWSYNFGSGYFARKVPVLNFAELPSMQNYFGNRFIDYRIRLSNMDMIRFDHFLTQFGYSVNEKLENKHFFGREYFNFIKAEDVLVNILTSQTGIDLDKADYSFTIGVINAIESGIRIWHVKPNKSAFSINPVVVPSEG